MIPLAINLRTTYPIIHLGYMVGKFNYPEKSTLWKCIYASSDLTPPVWIVGTVDINFI